MDITQLKQTTYRDTDEYADPDMFGGTGIPKYNSAPKFKTSPNFDESANIYDDQTFGFGKCVPNIIWVHKHTILVMETILYNLIVLSATRDNPATLPPN